MFADTFMEGGAMAHGENNAKEIVLTQAEDLSRALGNGSAGDVKKHGEAFSLILQMLKPIYRANLVTVEDMETYVGEQLDQCSAVNHPPRTPHPQHKNFPMDFKVGPVTWHGPITVLGGLAMLFGFLIGKGLNWW